MKLICTGTNSCSQVALARASIGVFYRMRFIFQINKIYLFSTILPHLFYFSKIYLFFKNWQKNLCIFPKKLLFVSKISKKISYFFKNFQKHLVIFSKISKIYI